MIAIVLGSLNFNKIREFLIGALGQEANIIINTQVSQGPMVYPWHNLAQGGENKDWRLAPLTNQVKALQPQYIRLDHLYDFYDIVHGSPGQLTMDFSKLDVIIQDIRATGATPFLSLSYTPPAIAVGGDITAPPARWTDWQFVVQRTIEHVSGTLNIPNVYYEVWNEPDLFGGYKTYGDKNYLTMYQYAAQGAKNARVRQPYKIGGPAITALYKNWVDSMIQMCLDQNLPLDFFSWHRYSRDVDVFRQDISQVRQWLAAYPQKSNIELDITEWGHDPQNDSGYDGQFGAIHTIAVSTELIGNIDKAFVFEIQDGKDPAGQTRWGRWGLFDSQNQAKPRYSALRFLDRLTGERVQLLGRGTWVKGVSSKAGQDILTILANFDPAGRHIETVPITWKGITPGNFEIETQFFAGSSNKQRVATTGAELHIDVPMPINSAVFVKLHPVGP
ncbi:MAG: glycosyl hydrolase [Candidatus Woesebacteria bacterium]